MRLVRRSTVITCALLAGVDLCAQSPRPPAAGTGVIVGQVVDARDNRPVAGAIVSLGGGPLPSAGATAGIGAPTMVTPTAPASPRRVMADNLGRYMFFALPAGTYTVSASAPGYLTGVHGQTGPQDQSRPVVLKDNDKTGGVTIALWRQSALSGTVVDEAGEPAININVQLFRRTTTGLTSRFVPTSSVRTDDRGIYRASSLAPGEYIVGIPSSTVTMPVSAVEAMQAANAARDNGAAATAMRETLNASSAPVPNAGGTRVGNMYVDNRVLGGLGLVAVQGDRVWTYQPTFYPGASSTAQAAPIAVGPGEERSGVDIQLRPAPTFRVSGTLVGGGQNPANLGVRLRPANDELSLGGMGASMTVAEADGSFTFLGIPPGTHTIQVLRAARPTQNNLTVGPNGAVSLTTRPAAAISEPTLWAETNVSIGDSDVAGVSLVLRAGARISGRIEFDGSSPRPPLDRGLMVTFQAIDSRWSINGPGAASVSASGQFTGPSLPPGRYIVSASAPGWILRSAVVGAVDMSAVPIDLEATDIGGVVVTLFDRPAQMSGEVRNGRGEPAGDATVFVIPANYRASLDAGISPRNARTSRTSSDGKYSVSGLLPGEYFVLAANENLPRDGGDPVRFYERAAGLGTRITIAPGDRRTQDLSITQVPIR